MTTRTLFLLKRREDYSQDPSYSGSYQIATGMFNSSKFVVDELQAAGREAQLGLVVDGNSIDAAVMAYNPTHVIIEGLWVVPSKFAELMSLGRHKNAHNGAGRKWIVRLHSEIPFIATEGIAMGWEAEYAKLGVIIAPNAPRAHQQVLWHIQNLVDATLPDTPENLVPYLPNCFPTNFEPINLQALDTSAKTTIDIGCFGAFRPLKNHLQQAFVAARYAKSIGKQLRFHINGRMDAGGQAPMKNTIQMLESVGAEVVEHGWEDRETFLESLRNVDVLFQMSMTETFNIVAADAILVGTPVLASNEINWLYPLYADPQDVDDALQKLSILMSSKAFFVKGSRTGLKRYAKNSVKAWLNYLPA